MDEENGGRGHDAYAKDHAAELANHVAAIESDNGAEHPLGFNAKINPKGLPLLRPVQDVLQSFGANLIELTDRSPGADIAPLAKAGVPTLGILQDARTYFNYHHTAADTLDKIVPQELRENAAAMAPDLGQDAGPAGRAPEPGTACCASPSCPTGGPRRSGWLATRWCWSRMRWRSPATSAR